MNFKVSNSFAVSPTKQPPRITFAFGKFTVTSANLKTFPNSSFADLRATRTRASNSPGAEWLGHIIAGTHFEEQDFVRHLRLCAQHNDWQPGSTRVMCWQTSCPEMSGKRRSRTIAEGLLLQKSSRPEVPSLAKSTSYPSDSKSRFQNPLNCAVILNRQDPLRRCRRTI
jgi:hypothetical protein